MPAENPFGEIDRAFNEALQKHLDVAKELDAMETDVTSWEASFLESIIKQLEGRTPLSQKQIDVLHRMCEAYEIECDF